MKTERVDNCSIIEFPRFQMFMLFAKKNVISQGLQVSDPALPVIVTELCIRNISLKRESSQNGFFFLNSEWPSSENKIVLA